MKKIKITVVYKLKKYRNPLLYTIILTVCYMGFVSKERWKNLQIDRHDLICIH